MSQVTDPVADLLTRIRNANSARLRETTVPASRVKEGILRILKAEGFIRDFSRIDEGPQGVLRVKLKYGPRGERMFSTLRRVSSPGRRVYRGVKTAERVLDGLGTAILSTSRGLLTDREARKLGVGGEVLCQIW